VGTETIEGVVERITYENAQSGFRVIKVAVAGRAERLAVIGTLPSTPLGARVRVRGQIENDRKHGPQLRAESMIELAPDTLAGLEKYLASGVVKGVGPKLAHRVVAAFGLDALRVLDDEPQRLREVEGLGDKRGAALARTWREQRATRDVMVFLQSHGASCALATRIVRRYGDRAMGVVSRDPYRLALDVHGVGFKTADRIASSMGVAPNSPERFQAGLLQVLHDMSDAGHVWTTEEEVLAHAAQMLGFEADDEVQARLRHALSELVLAGRAVVEEVGVERAVFAARMHAAEVRLARRLTEIARASVRPLDGTSAALHSFERIARIELAPEQRHAVEEAARSPVVVITGGPGVGKTTIVRAILAVFAAANVDVRLAAPTGRAAKRMSEATGADATTLHRLLDFDPKTGAFKRDRNRPIDTRALVVDEASMLDLETADALTQAVAPGTRLLLVGDVDQLPSVAPGAVLRDVIASGVVPCVRFRQIFRQAARSLIVTNAHRINDGLSPIAAPPGSAADFFMVERRDPAHALATVLELVGSRIPERFGLDPVRDIQVLTPMNRGTVGAAALNEALQALLNPIDRDAPAPAPEKTRTEPPQVLRGGRTYRAFDKVMQLRNDYEKNVFNGDVGLVSRIDPEENRVVVRFDDREISFDASELDDLTLAYACTIHKAQGSEYPAVVLPLLTSHYVMLSKNLLYTAVTRGKRLVVLVCDPRAVELALSERRKAERRTRLASRIRGQLA
jgi:exodeoxyribonuclease V alpha subunit